MLREREARFMSVAGEERPMGKAVQLEQGAPTPRYGRLAELPFAQQL